MTELIWISSDFPLVQLLLSREYLLQILLAMIDRPLLSIVTSGPNIIPLDSFDSSRHPLQFRLIISSLRFQVFFLSDGRVRIIDKLSTAWKKNQDLEF